MMARKKIAKEEAQIGERLRIARESYGFTQTYCAAEILVERTTLRNYESGITPLRSDVALRFCRSFIVSEEWLATGQASIMRKIAVERQLPGGDWTELEKIFTRQCMDLLSDPVTQKIPHGMPFAAAWDVSLRHRYLELGRANFYLPRILLTDADFIDPKLAKRLFGVYLENWLRMLNNAALKAQISHAETMRQFFGAISMASGHVFRKFLGVDLSGDASWEKLEWLRQSLLQPTLKVGPLHQVPSRNSHSKLHSELAT